MPSAKNVAVVGCGHWGRNLVRNFAQLGSLATVCDTSPEALHLAREIAPQAKTLHDFSEALASPVDGVVIATPSKTHYSMARNALEAGKDVLVEKPLALTYKEGVDLVHLAEERGRVLMVGHVLEYHPAVARLLDLVNEGDLGTIRYIYSNRLSLGIVRREENILWSFAPHDIAVILRLVGGMPLQVVACGGSYLQPNVADVTVTNLLFENGARAHIHVSWLHPFKEQRLVVVGSRKMASFDDVEKKLVLYDQRVEVNQGQPVPIKGRGEEIDFAADEPLLLECRAFLESLSTRQPPITDGRSAVRVLRVLQETQRSLMNNGEPMTLSVEPFGEDGSESTDAPARRLHPS